MADNNIDPAGSTQMFRAFVDEGVNNSESRTSSSGRTGMIAVAAVVVIAILVAVVWLAVR